MEDARVVIMVVYLVACYCFAYYGVERNEFFSAHAVRLFLLPQLMILLYCDVRGEVMVVS